MVDTTGHIDRVKVNSSELKTHLGQYLRSVERDSTTLEICIRDRTVAYLVPANQTVRLSSVAQDSPLLALKQAGMLLQSPQGGHPSIPLPAPVLAGDGREDASSTDSMRAGRDW